MHVTLNVYSDSLITSSGNHEASQPINVTTPVIATMQVPHVLAIVAWAMGVVNSLSLIHK